MRNRWSRVAAVAAIVGAAAAAFQIDPDIVTDVSTPATGLRVPAPSTGDIVRVDAASGGVTARVNVANPGAELRVAERDNGVVVVDQSGARVVLIDPALHEITREVRTAGALGWPVDIGPDAIVVASGSQVSLVDPDVTAAITADLGRTVRSAVAGRGGAVAETVSSRHDIDFEGAVSAAVDSPGVLVRARDRRGEW